MKRLLSLLAAVLMLLCWALGVAGCSGNNPSKTNKNDEEGSDVPKTPVEELTEKERMLYDALLAMSGDFNDPSAVRLLEVGDYKIYNSADYTGMGKGAFYGVAVKLQGENKAGGTLSGYFLLRTESVTLSDKSRAKMEEEARFDSSSYWQKSWDECPADEFPRSSCDTFEDYRETMVNFYLDNYYFKDEAAAREAAEEYFNSLFGEDYWDNCAEDAYPRKYFNSYEAWHDKYVSDKFNEYHYPYDFTSGSNKVEPDTRGLYTPLVEDYAIVSDAESTFDVSKINKALKYYWDERLGNS